MTDELSVVRPMEPSDLEEITRRSRGPLPAPDQIPWRSFDKDALQRFTPADLLLWWVPIRGSVEVFTGRVGYWPTADAVMVGRRTGSAVRVAAGSFYAVITEPTKPAAIDDALECFAAADSSVPPKLA